MARFFSIPGLSHGQNNLEGDRPGPGFRGSLPDPRENPLMKEFYDARKPTSHSTFGLDAETFHHHRGEVCRVEGEERNSEGGVDIHVQVSSKTDAGLRKIRTVPDGPRTLRVVETQRST